MQMKIAIEILLFKLEKHKTDFEQNICFNFKSNYNALKFKKCTFYQCAQVKWYFFCMFIFLNAKINRFMLALAEDHINMDSVVGKKCGSSIHRPQNM